MRKAILPILLILSVLLAFTACDGNSDEIYLGNTVFTVTFDVQEHGAAPQNQELKTGSYITEPEKLSATDYIFKGWYKEAGCKTEWNFERDTVTEDTTLYAKWIQIAGNKAVSSTYTSRTDCYWVQLWEDGPKFATFNVGSTITDYASATATSDQYTTENVGGLYQWGGTNNFDVSDNNYPANDCNTGSSDLIGESDTATKLWGNNWRMPTVFELTNLWNPDNCTWTWISGEGEDQYVTDCTLAGYKVSGKGDYENNSIFLPAAGYYQYYWSSQDVYYEGVYGDYWSSTPYIIGCAYSIGFDCDGQGVDCSSFYYYNYGFSVRAVLNELGPEQTITIEAGSNGTISGGTSLKVPENAAINISENILKYGDTTITAVADSDYAFDGWYLDGKQITISNYKVTEGVTISVKFSLKTSSATVSGSTSRTNCTWVKLWAGGPKFATFNVGSTITSYASATDYTTANIGGYYEWGGTTDKDTVKTNYSTSTNDISGTADDTAKNLWGSNWRMPTKDELQNLVDNCTWKWFNGSTEKYLGTCTLAGYKVSGKAGTDYEDCSIFLPAAGFYNSKNTITNESYRGDYWSSTPNSYYSNFAYYLYLYQNKNYGEIESEEYYYGCSVRAVYVGE